MANTQVIPTASQWPTGVSLSPADWAALWHLPKPHYVVDTNGAIPVLAQSVYITKATAAVLTLATPVAGKDDGKQIRIISTTAAAHTVTNATTGFNGAGAAGDVATFAAAIGNNLVVEAYNGKWYVVSSVGVTIA